MKRIIVLGAEGMLGHKMCQILTKRFPATACTILGSRSDEFYNRIDLFKQMDLIENINAMDLPQIDNVLSRLRPEFIVNCIGIIKQRDEAMSAISSITLNSLLPHRLAAKCAEWRGKVIHFSTDCVFDGTKGSYTEEDTSTAVDLYGKSKYLGEVATSNALTLRTSIIGRELNHYRSLLEWFIAQEGKTVKGYTRVLYSGVTTNHMANVVADVIENHPDLSGLYHLTADTISKHDLLCLIRDEFNLNIEVVPDDKEISDRSMIGDKFNSNVGRVSPSWEQLITELVEDPTNYPAWRQ